MHADTHVVVADVVGVECRAMLLDVPFQVLADASDGCRLALRAEWVARQMHREPTILHIIIN